MSGSSTLDFPEDSAASTASSTSRSHTTKSSKTASSTASTASTATTLASYSPENIFLGFMESKMNELMRKQQALLEREHDLNQREKALELSTAQLHFYNGYVRGIKSGGYRGSSRGGSRGGYRGGRSYVAAVARSEQQQQSQSSSPKLD